MHGDEAFNANSQLDGEQVVTSVENGNDALASGPQVCSGRYVGRTAEPLCDLEEG